MATNPISRIDFPNNLLTACRESVREIIKYEADEMRLYSRGAVAYHVTQLQVCLISLKNNLNKDLIKNKSLTNEEKDQALTCLSLQLNELIEFSTTILILDPKFRIVISKINLNIVENLFCELQDNYKLILR